MTSDLHMKWITYALILAAGSPIAASAGAPTTNIAAVGTAPTSAAANIAPATQAATAAVGTTASPPPPGPAFNETQRLFQRAFTSTMAGSVVLGSLKATGDAELEPFFLAVSRSKSPELQLIGLLDANEVGKNSAIIHIPKLLAIPIPRLIGPSLAVMIHSGNISSAQLMEVVNTAIDPAEKLMAASELVNRGKAARVIPVLDQLAESQTDSIRYYAALTLLQCKSPEQARRGLNLLRELAVRKAVRLVDLKEALLAQVAAQRISAAGSWAELIAKNSQNPWSLRRRAVQTLLAIGAPAGPPLLAEMIHFAKGTIDKIELGLLAVQYPKGLAIADLQTLKQTDSPLLMGIAKTAAAAVSGKSPLPGILALIQQGQPIFMNWALAYASGKDISHRRKILQALIEYATAAGDGADTDFRRAIAAATVLADANGPLDRKILAADLDSSNAGVVEAVLAGMIQSRNADFAPLIEPLWSAMLKRDHRKIREFAAMELAREGKKVELPVLRDILLYGLRRSDGFRAAAGWYYVKLTGRGPSLLLKWSSN